MKKLFIIVLFLFTISFLNGCYIDEKREEMDLVSVKVYDSEGKEINGVYDYEYDYIESLNSAKPSKVFYLIEASKDETYTVKFYFQTKKDKIIKSMDLYDQNDKFIVKVDDAKDSGNENEFILTFTVSSIESNSLYEVKYWYDEDKNKHDFGFVANNQYIRGVLFYFKNTEELSCLL